MTDLEPVVQIEIEGRRFTVRVDRNGPLAFWRVECGERVYRSPMRVLGDEQPDFFHGRYRDVPAAAMSCEALCVRSILPGDTRGYNAIVGPSRTDC